MAEIMTFGPMVSDKSQYQDIMILMRSLLVQFYEKHKKEANHEIFWKTL